MLLSTDLAARGIDFPVIDRVLQLDAPEDAEAYVHRAGRTARYESHGQVLLLLCPSEEEGASSTELSRLLANRTIRLITAHAVPKLDETTRSRSHRAAARRRETETGRNSCGRDHHEGVEGIVEEGRDEHSRQQRRGNRLGIYCNL